MWKGLLKKKCFNISLHLSYVTVITNKLPFWASSVLSIKMGLIKNLSQQLWNAEHSRSSVNDGCHHHHGKLTVRHLPLRILDLFGNIVEGIPARVGEQS